MTAFSTTRDVAERTALIVLSERDAERVLNLLENPPEPTPALIAAARRRRRCDPSSVKPEE